MVLTDRPGHGLFTAELPMLSRHLDLTVHELHGAPVTDQTLAALLPPRFLRNRLDYYVAGAPSLVVATVSALTELGVPPRRVHTEQFDV